LYSSLHGFLNRLPKSMAEVCQHSNTTNLHHSNKCNASNKSSKRSGKQMVKHNQKKAEHQLAEAPFVSKCTLWQTNPRKTNYTIYVKIMLNPPNREAQEVRFPYQPDRESLTTVIEEMVDALQLNQAKYHSLIVQRIESTMKSKRMKIVRASPIHPQQTPQMHVAAHSHAQSPQCRHHNHNHHHHHHKLVHSSVDFSPNLTPKRLSSPKKLSSPRKLSKAKQTSLSCDDCEYVPFSPLSPLTISPRILHRKSAAWFPKLRQSVSESDPLSLMKQIKSNEELYSASDTNSRRDTLREHDLMDTYIDDPPNDEDIIVDNTNMHM